MRITIIMVVITMLCCCKKKVDDFNGVGNNLVSMWELRKSVGGFAGTITYQPGNNRTVEFKSDNSFVNSDKGRILSSGTYDLQTTSEKDQYKLTFLMDTIKQSLNITLKSDTLWLLAPESCCDMPSSMYIRIHPLPL